MRTRLNKLMNNKTFLKILSVFLAVIFWLVVVYLIDKSGDKIIDDVEVDISAMADEVLAPLNLYVVEGANVKVSVTVTGERYILGGLEPSDIAIVADLGGITDADTYDVVLSGKKFPNYNEGDKNNKGFTIKSISPNKTRIRVDRQTKKKFPIKTDIEGLQFPDDYIGSETLLNPKEVTITGPDADVSKIDKCVVSASFTSPLTTNKAVRSEIVLYDAEGNVLSKDFLTMDSEMADITIPVLKKKTLTVDFDFLNVPSGFPIDRMEPKFSQSSVNIAGPEAVVDAYGDMLNVGFIPLEDVTKDSVHTFEIDLPTGCILLDDIKNIAISFDTPEMQDLQEATFTIPKANIKPINVPVNYDVRVESASIPNVHVTGDPELLALLSGSDLVAEINMTDRQDISTGPYSLPVRISAPGKGFVWATGSYVAVVNIVEK